MKKVIITGVGGFLGRQVAHHYLRRGWQVFGVGDCPRPFAPALTQYVHCAYRLPHSDFDTLLEETRPDVCVHCAGRSSVAGSFENPDCDFRDGPLLVFELLDSLQSNSPLTRLIFVSSAAVYGEPSVLPISEDLPTAPISPYGKHKVESEKLCAGFALARGISAASVRVFSAFGRGLRRQVMWDICDKLTTQKRPCFQGTGNESRDFVHAKDVASAIYHVAERAPCNGEAYNIGSGAETRIADLAEAIRRQLVPRASVTFDGILPMGVPRNWRADLTRIGRLGWKPDVQLDLGVIDFVRWYRQQEPELCCTSD